MFLGLFVHLQLKEVSLVSSFACLCPWLWVWIRAGSVGAKLPCFEQNKHTLFYFIKASWKVGFLTREIKFAFTSSLTLRLYPALLDW